MEKYNSKNNFFLHYFESIALSLFIIFFFLIWNAVSKGHPLSVRPFFTAAILYFLFFYIIINLIFSGIFYLLKKEIPWLLYLGTFFFGLWALLFILSNAQPKKSTNEIPDIMDGLSESITVLMIKFICFLLSCNYLIALKNWYLGRKSGL